MRFLALIKKKDIEHSIEINWSLAITPLLFFIKGTSDRGCRVNVGVEHHEADSGGSNGGTEYRKRYGNED
jgi:hypothetical protein